LNAGESLVNMFQFEPGDSFSHATSKNGRGGQGSPPPVRWVSAYLVTRLSGTGIYASTWLPLRYLMAVSTAS